MSKKVLVMSATLLLSFALVHSKRLPFSKFESIATKDIPGDPMRPTRRSPKDINSIPELKNMSTYDKKKWTDISRESKEALQEIFTLEKDSTARMDYLYRKYRRLFEEAKRLFKENFESKKTS